MSNTTSNQSVDQDGKPPIPRLTPDQPLPPYSFVPGYHPHPVSDPLGHSYGEAPEAGVVPDLNNWSQCRPYLRGIDLFNHGYYWEAHEAWESLWHVCGRHGETADFIKGLIQLAVAGVKVRQGMVEGVLIHAKRACEIFTKAASSHPTYMGMDLPQLTDSAREIMAKAHEYKSHPDLAVEIVFSFSLRPS